jgi:predicted ATPase
MGQLFPGFQLEVKRVDAANLVTIGIRTHPGGDFYRPTNVGFGLSHILPIFVAAVAMQPGRTLVVENPETHLHPAAQSLTGYFLAMAASAGVQLIIETHSDHVLNGIRRAIRDSRLKSDDAAIYFFSGERIESGAAFDNVTVDGAGRIKGWPPGFFDQMERDIDYIFHE